MSMGIVSDDDFEKELANSGISYGQRKDTIKEATEEVTIEQIKRGRGEGRTEVPKEIRELAAISAINREGNGKDIARAFEISPSSVSAYKVGSHSTASYNKPNESLLDKLNSHKERVSRKARRNLVAALDQITPDKLSNVKVRDLAAIAKDMSSIVKDMQPEVASTASNQTNVQFVFMAPRVKDIEDYRVMEVDT